MLNPNVKVYTITELNNATRILLEDSFYDIWVEGEISNFKLHSAGHIYFSLKDDEAQINAVMYKGITNGLKFQPEDGLKVIAKGRVSCFVKRGIYQIVIYYMEPSGKGALQLAFEQLKEKLKKEGLFDSQYKKPIPMLPQKIGIVTSPTGAAVRDILSVIKRRFANIHIMIYPVLVQGDQAKDEIVQAIRDLNKNFPELDVIILTRGGGSLEDLWPFNEEIVARAIFASNIPIISAVGHEIDYTISDFVSDLRAPTPSAAAELVVKNKIELVQHLLMLKSRLVSFIENKLLFYSRECEDMVNSMVFTQPYAIYDRKQQDIDYYYSKLGSIFKHFIEVVSKELFVFIGKLEVLSPLSVLARGYSITLKLPERNVLTDIKEINVNDMVNVRLHNGQIDCRVEKVFEEDVKK